MRGTPLPVDRPAQPVDLVGRARVGWGSCPRSTVGDAARGYSWPPFEPDNEAAMKHGADSERRVGPLAAALAAELAETAPWTSRPAHRAAVMAWARAEARCRLVGDWLDEHGLLDDEGRPRPAANMLDRLEGRAGRLRHELGITPMGHARLLVAVAEVVRSQPAGVAAGPLDGALAELLAEGRRALEAGAGRLRAVGSGGDSREAGWEGCGAGERREEER